MLTLSHPLQVVLDRGVEGRPVQLDFYLHFIGLITEVCCTRGGV